MKLNTELLFRVGMWWRIGYGSLRTLVGFFLLRLVHTPLTDLFTHLMRHELIEDRHDVVYQHVNSFLVHHSFTVTYFLAFYLIFWGITDVFLSIQLLRHQHWAFPVSLVLIGIFIVYEVLRFTHTHSLVLLGVILIDMAVFWIIRREYRRNILRKGTLEVTWHTLYNIVMAVCLQY